MMNIPQNIFILCLIFSWCCLTESLASASEWLELEDTRGRQVEARILDVSESRVEAVRRSDGRRFFLKLDDLSSETRLRILQLNDPSVVDQPAPRQLPNLVFNPSFDDLDWYRPNAALHWMDRPFLKVEETGARSGSYGLVASGPGEGYTFQDLTLIPGQRYRASFYAQGRGDTDKDQGVRLRVGREAGPWSGGSRGWVQHEFEFTAGADVGMLCLDFDLPDGAVIRVDDISLMTLDGELQQAPEPEIVTKPGTYQGLVFVELKSELPDSVIRYTLDGSDPHRFSTPYRTPFFLHGSSEVRAAVFQDKHARSEVTSAHFEITPRMGGGVPSYPVGWGQPVDEWWQGHIYNPESPNHFKGPVESPAARVNVAEVRAQYPDSDTAGIEEALALLPEQGGTLWFPRSGSPYTITRDSTVVKNYYFLDAPIHILRRSNIHFLSDGATIEVTHSKSEGSGHPGIFAFCSMEYADTKEFQKPVRNFYFRGLTFDGTNSGAVSAFLFRHCADILFEDCAFVNFVNPSKRYHPGLINATSMTDNIWLRDCRLMDGKLGVYWDGVLNGGFVNCEFGPGLAEAAILLLCNNDMVHYSAVQRTCQYIVLANSRLEGSGSDLFTSTAANVLVKDNEITGHYDCFINQTGRGRSNMRPFVRYNGTGFHVEGNTIERVSTFARFRGDCAQFTREADFTMRNVLVGNRVGNTVNVLETGVRTSLDVIENISITENYFGQIDGALVEMGQSDIDQVYNIEVRDNDIDSEEPESLVVIRGGTGNQTTPQVRVSF